MRPWDVQSRSFLLSDARMEDYTHGKTRFGLVGHGTDELMRAFAGLVVRLYTKITTFG